MTHTVVLVHGWGGTHRLHWQSWLSQELQSHGDFRVLFPAMPTPALPIESEWVATLREIVSPNEESVSLVGHSLGCPTILRFLETLEPKQQLDKVVLVAGFARPLGIREIDDFVRAPFDWKKIRQSVRHFVVIYSNNDPFIPVSESLYLARALGVEPILEEKAGHLTAPDFGPYPRIFSLLTAPI